MADYYPVLSRAVAGLENNTGEARRAVYERARSAIIRQLRAIDPPLAEEDIARERMQLEEAIRKVEASAAGSPAPAAARPAAPAPQTPTPPRPQPAPQDQAKPAAPQRPAAPQPRAPQPAPDGGQERPRGPARPATRPDGRPIIRTKAEDGKGGSKRSAPLVAGIALAILAIGAGLFLGRSHIAAMFGGSKNAEVAKTEQPAPAPKPDDSAAKPSDAGKSDDRLPQDGAQNNNPPPAASQPDQPKPDQQQANAEQPPAQQPSPTPEPVPAPAPQTQQPSPGGPLVAQRAVLYEEGSNQQSGEAVSGTIVWRTESVPGGSNQPLETAVRGDIEIPGRKLKANIVIRRNADATLPASHTIEIQFTLPENFANAGISNVPGVLMKADESARGAAVAGLSVRVTSGFFLIGLSNLDTERPVNEQLLRDRGWMDIPILYDNGRRAVLTLEKGTPGTQAFNDAFNAWKSSSTAAGQPPQQN